MSESHRPRLRFGKAVQRLHEALPRRMNFSIGRSDFQHTHDDEDGTRDVGKSRDREPQWSVVVQGPHDPSEPEDARYVHESLGTDLAAVVEEALNHFRQWEVSTGVPAAGTDKPPKLVAPGTADRVDSDRLRKDVS